MKVRSWIALLTMFGAFVFSGAAFAAQVRTLDGYEYYDIRDLLQDTRDNRVRFEKTYKDQKFNMLGYVVKIDIQDEGYVMQMFGENKIHTVTCVFVPEEEDNLITINPQDIILLTGTYRGREKRILFDTGDFTLFDCRLIGLYGNVKDYDDATVIVNDLRNLKSAALLFYGDNLHWPAQSNVSSLDNYADRPFVNANPPRYGKVIISDEVKDQSGVARAYIGVELFANSNGRPSVKNYLAGWAIDKGLLNSVPEEGKEPEPYTHSDIVWMNMK